MVRFTLLAVALFLVASVLANQANPVQLGSFEGSYSSKLGLGTHICQNGDFVYGYTDESIIFRGTAIGDTFTGNFYQAGTGNCATGTIEFDYTPWGFEGTYVCAGNGRVEPFTGVKNSVFRPSDDACARLYEGDDLDLEGEYLDVHFHEFDLCFRVPDDDNNDDDDETVQASLERDDENYEGIEQFLTGFHYVDGKIFVGTWYENFNAGAVMMYLRENGDVDYTYWTGLLRTEGETFIDGTHSFDNSLHWTGTWKGPRQSAVASKCVVYEALQYVVLQNLQAAGEEDDDNYYYFIDTLYLSYFRYHVESSSDASTLCITLALFVVALLF